MIWEHLNKARYHLTEARLLFRALAADSREESRRTDKDLELYGTVATEHRWAHAATSRLAEMLEHQISELLDKLPQAR